MMKIASGLLINAAASPERQRGVHRHARQAIIARHNQRMKIAQGPAIRAVTSPER